MSQTSTASGVMDRLSDAVGNHYPGGRHLRARHPIKVTLLMGLLGLASGWLTMIAGVGLAHFVFHSDFAEEPIFLTAGFVLALVVVIPWAVWLGARVLWLVPLLAYVAIGNAIWFAVIEQFQSSQPMWGLFLYGVLTGAFLAVPGMAITRRSRPVWILLTVFISGASMSSFMLIKDQPLLNQLPMKLRTPLVIAWFFTLLHTPLAVCLGFPLWDWTPLPRPELDEEIGENL